MNSSDMQLYSWFLGPKAENADIFERLIIEAIKDCVFWRRNFHPEDEVLITERVKSDTLFQESNDLLQQEFLKLLAELKRGIPSYSPRYIGHMLGDQLLPAVVGYFAAMLHNHNNVTSEASPITTDKELDVAKELAKMVGYKDKDNTWGHITSGGTIGNFEAIWVARNLKYYPLAVKRAKEENATLPNTDNIFPSLDPWKLLNMEVDDVLRIRERLCEEYEKENLQNIAKKVAEELNIAEKVVKELNSAEIILDDDKKKATIKSDDARTDELEVRKEDDKLNVYKDKILDILSAEYAEYKKDNQKKNEEAAKKEIEAKIAKQVENAIDNLIKSYTISGMGIHAFFNNFKDIEPGVILMPATAHYSLKKVTEALGIGQNQIKYIPVDEHFRMDIDSLEEILEECLENKKPIIALISVLGSTEEGAVDHIHKIIESQTRFGEKGLKFYHHCDAAWGGYIRTLFYDENGDEVINAGAIMKITRTWPPDEIFNSFRVIYKADSVTLDPHKLGYIPYPAGAIVFKNKSVRELISYDAPYIFREEEKEGPSFIGRYILEGSKPGAAAVACWLAQKIVPLNQSGYGEIIGKSLQSAQEFNLKFKDLCLELQKKEIKLRVLTDPPDTNIFCFIVNYKGNQFLQEMNELNNDIYNELKFNPEEPIQTHEFIISRTDFEHKFYGKTMKKNESSMQKHLDKIGIGENEFTKNKKITILRCTFMSPWPALSRGGEPDYVEAFALELKKTIEKVVEKKRDEKLKETLEIKSQ
jgi:glutamate/tyrosine decarboxylase-like PLP-dependent enzyme